MVQMNEQKTDEAENEIMAIREMKVSVFFHF
jgi:hypothetical protein